MIKIVVGGQIEKQAIASKIEEIAKDKVTIDIKGDLDAAMAMNANEYDYYFGACNTGGGGALAMAIALLGKDSCATVSMPSSVLSAEEIIAEVKSGKKAFGFTPQHLDVVVPIIMKTILEEKGV